MAADLVHTRPPINALGGHLGQKAHPATIDPKTSSLINLDLLGDSASLPASNEENRALEQELVAQRKKLLKCQTEIESLQQKTDSIWKHLSNMRIDLNESQVSDADILPHGQFATVLGRVVLGHLRVVLADN